MNQILKLREERANTWEMAKAFLESPVRLALQAQPAPRV